MKHRSWWPAAGLDEPGQPCTVNTQRANQDQDTLAWDQSLLVDIPSLRPTPVGGCGTIFPQQSPEAPLPSQQSEAHGIARVGQTWGVHTSTAVFLTDASRELLLSVMPPLHPQALATMVLLAEHMPLEHVLSLPLGAQVTLQLTGLAADSSMQAASCQLPDWCPRCQSAVPYLVISCAEGTDAAYAERLVAEGVCGASCAYYALSESLPLVGLLGALPPGVPAHVRTGAHGPADVPFFCADQLAAHCVHGFMEAGAHQQTIPGTAQAANPTWDSFEPDQPQDNSIYHVAAHEPQPVHAPAPLDMPQDVPPAQTSPSSEPPQAAQAPAALEPGDGGPVLASQGGSDSTQPAADDFELWMQQDERLVVPAAADAPPGGSPTPALLLQGGVAERHEGEGGPVVLLSDVGMGDMVSMLPLVAADDSDNPLVQGIVAELVVDDPLQPHGVLVRLEDDTLGHVMHVINKAYRQTQEAWPVLPGGPTATHANQQGLTQGKEQAPSNTPAAKFQPSGGIRVLRASNKPKLLSPASKKGGRRSGAGIGGDADDGTSVEARQAQVLRDWQDLQRRFGEAICEAVLADCQNVMLDAVQVMQDQDRLPELLGDIVQRSVARVEDQALRAQEEEEQRMAAERQAAQAATRKWAPRPGSGPSLSYVRGADRRSAPPPPVGTFPSLPGGVRGRIGPQANGSWAAGAPPQVKLLRNSSSLASVAAAAGLNVKDVEALAQAYPGLSGRQVASLLDLSAGSVAAAVDELRALGLEPGSGDGAAYEAVMEVFGLTEDQAPSTGATATHSAGDTTAPAKRDAEWEEKVSQLQGWFEGLEREVAEYALQSHAGDVQRAAEELAHGFQAHTRADDYARSLQLAAQLAASSTYAAASAEPQARSQSAAVSRGSSTSGTPLGATTPTRSGVGGDGATPERRAGAGSGGWQVVGGNSTAPRKPRSAADIQRAKLRVTAGKARHIANIYYDARNVFFQHAAAAHAAGDGKAAADFARKGREYGELAKQYRTTANDESYKLHNLGVQNCFTMDLHGMHVEEALDMLSQQLDALRRLVVPEGVMLKAITGRGNHSVRNVAAIKPAVLEWLRAQRYKHFVEPGNEGVVVVHVVPELKR